MSFLSLCQLLSVYGIIFFIFLSVSMASHPQHFQFQVNDDLITCSIVVTVLYGALLLITSLMAYWRGKQVQQRGQQGRNLMSEDEERNQH